MADIYISGSLAFDRIVVYEGYFKDHILPDKIHALNFVLLVRDLTERYGGTAGNIAYSLGLLGEAPVVLANMGHDATEYKQWLERWGVNTTHIGELSDALTATATIMTDKADNQIGFFYPGAMDKALASYPTAFTEGSIAILSPGNITDMMELKKHYVQNAVPHIFDPGQILPALSSDQCKDLITDAQILVVNDYEYEVVLQKTQWSKEKLLGMIPAVIVTKGEQGSELLTAQEALAVPAVLVKNVVDPTGAGDAYRAGFLYGMMKKRSMVDAMKLGTVVASFAVEHSGGQTHTFQKETLQSRFRETFNENLVI